jgi:hypothetical protein
VAGEHVEKTQLKVRVRLRKWPHVCIISWIQPIIHGDFLCFYETDTLPEVIDFSNQHFDVGGKKKEQQTWRSRHQPKYLVS